jgi:hypothetical protein
MKRLVILLLAWILVLPALGQAIPPKVNTIIVTGVTFSEVCNALLDARYAIDRKDSDLQTIRTEAKAYPKYWNATYIINVRVKDSTAYITGTATVADGQLFKDEPIYNQTDRKGATQPKSMFGYAFLLLNEFAQSFKREVSYQKI